MFIPEPSLLKKLKNNYIYYRGRFQHKDPFLNLENNHLGWKDCDWEVPPVAEETIDRIATMMTIYPRYTYKRNLNTICHRMVV